MSGGGNGMMNAGGGYGGGWGGPGSGMGYQQPQGGYGGYSGGQPSYGYNPYGGSAMYGPMGQYSPNRYSQQPGYSAEVTRHPAATQSMMNPFSMSRNNAPMPQNAYSGSNPTSGVMGGPTGMTGMKSAQAQPMPAPQALTNANQNAAFQRPQTQAEYYAQNASGDVRANQPQQQPGTITQPGLPVPGQPNPINWNNMVYTIPPRDMNFILNWGGYGNYAQDSQNYRNMYNQMYNGQAPGGPINWER